MAFNPFMHERNIYKNQPDFAQIALDFPAFQKFAIPDAKGKKVRVDFSNPDALRMLTEVLLKKDFNLDVEIPQGFLIPTIPQRLNYILWMEDLINNIPKAKDVICGIDIGTGPCAIFSLLGAQKNNWNFIATESSDVAIQWAKKNIEKNNLNDNIRVVKVNPGSTLSEILSSDSENYDFCLCNPPFFENVEEIRKKHCHSHETIADIAQREEIFFKGGELEFVKRILSDSMLYKNRICIFSSMFGKKKSFLQILKDIREIKDVKVTTTEFCQGNTIRWGIAWTFNESVQFGESKKSKKNKPKKAKPPLEYQIPLKDSQSSNLKKFVKEFKDFFKSLQIHVTVARSSQHYAELLLKSDENTWTHQRRKRREIERQKKLSDNLEKQLTISSEKETNEDPDITANSEATPRQNTSSSVDTNELQSNDNVNFSDSQNVSSNSKRKDIDLDDGSVNKKIKTEEQNENSYSEQCIPVPIKQSNLKSVYDSETNKMVCKTESNVEMSSVKKEISLEKNAVINENINFLQSSNNAEKSDSKNEDVSLDDNEMQCDRINELKFKSMSNNSCDSDIPGVSGIENSDKTKGNLDLLACKKRELESKMDTTNVPEGSVLDCRLQLIKGKNNIYVKMNCPPTADRNSMYQVFQLIKNKIN